MSSPHADATIERLVALLVTTHAEAHPEADLAWRAQDITRRVRAALFENEVLGESPPARPQPPAEANAYRRWTERDDQRLRELALTGASNDEIAARFKRKSSAIQSRLAKLALRDIGWRDCPAAAESAPTARDERDPEGSP